MSWPARARYLSGSHKPLYMMQGLDASFDAVFFVSYHGSMSARAPVLSHTYNPRAIVEARINGVVAGESGINALVARGTTACPSCWSPATTSTGEEAEKFMPGRARARW